MKKPTTTTKSVATTKDKTADVPSTLKFAAHSGMGLEGTGKDDFAIPFLTMLQGLSPQVTEQTVAGAKAGLLMNSVTNELFEIVRVVPCAYKRRFVRWAPRSKGGGYRGELSPLEVEAGSVRGCSQINGVFYMDVPHGTTQVTDNEGRPLFDHLADTRNHFILVQSKKGNWQPALMALSSTQIKHSKGWMSLINQLEATEDGVTFTPPSFSHTYLVKSKKESNTKGEWYGHVIALEKPLTDTKLYAAALKFHDDVVKDKIKVAQPPANTAETSSERF
jgi:hypothetical protein